MIFFKKKGVAWAVLLLCIMIAIFIGGVTAPDEAVSTPVMDYSKFERYIDDRGALLSNATEDDIARMNAQWDYEYDAHVAVATIDDPAVDVAKYAEDMWTGLEPRDILLVLAENGDWYVLPGNEADSRLTDSHYDNIGWSIQDNIDNDDAAAAFLDAVDDFFEDEMPRTAQADAAADDDDGSFLVGLILLVVIIFVIWLIIDAIRYSSYRRRYMRPGMGVPTRRYYPVFWGRRTMMPPRAPRRPSPPPPRPKPPRSNRPSGGFGGSRPSGGFNSRPSGGFGGSRTSNTRRPSGGFGGSRSSFGGGSRSSFGGGSRSGFGGSRGGFGGSRGGGRGGRR